MSRAWKDPDDVQQDILEQQQEINALVRAISIKLDEQQRTNQLLEQILNKLDHVADGGKKIVSGLDEGDPKGDESVIVEKKSGEEPLVFQCDEKSVEENLLEVINKLRPEIDEEQKPAEEKKAPLLIVFDADSPRGYCVPCNCETVYDKIHNEYFCPHCRRYIPQPNTPSCPVCGKEAEIVHGAYMTNDDWIYCKHCGVSSRRAK